MTETNLKPRGPDVQPLTGNMTFWFNIMYMIIWAMGRSKNVSVWMETEGRLRQLGDESQRHQTGRWTDINLVLLASATQDKETEILGCTAVESSSQVPGHCLWSYWTYLSWGNTLFFIFFNQMLPTVHAWPVCCSWAHSAWLGGREIQGVCMYGNSRADRTWLRLWAYVYLLYKSGCQTHLDSGVTYKLIRFFCI